ncbi:MAG: quinol:electron acceptor oxidoreductase subunit ActD [bacterium]|jgi:hypothetical protein|nr:DUF3341 domain-containing protein [Gemmatimonadota bacterium]HIL90484.1 DUF3341 domain-containing protein [Gemmatimonadota bacterium]
MQRNEKTWLHAVFESPIDAQGALQKLTEYGFDSNDIEVRSSIPLEGLYPPDLHVRSHVPLMAVLGGIVGGICAFMLTSLTSQAYPMETGGMPIVPLPTTGVITFEGIAIGAILTTVATVLYECGLPFFRMKSGPLDHYLAEGQIVIAAFMRADEYSDWTSKAVATKRQGPHQPPHSVTNVKGV